MIDVWIKTGCYEDGRAVLIVDEGVAYFVEGRSNRGGKVNDIEADFESFSDNDGATLPELLLIDGPTVGSSEIKKAGLLVGLKMKCSVGGNFVRV